MGIEARYVRGRHFSPASMSRLKRYTERHLKKGEIKWIRSASGASAVIIMNWCEENGIAYQLTFSPGAGYEVNLLEDTV